jgi:ribosome-binding protein aMBF1 (putative translation factor)
MSKPSDISADSLTFSPTRPLINRALDRKDDPTPPATISADVGKAMMKARQDLGLSQKDLAQKSNEVATLIQSYEGP